MVDIEYVCVYGLRGDGQAVFVFSPLTNFTIEWASSLSPASATQRDAHHGLYPALTDNLSTAYNSPLCAPREISTERGGSEAEGLFPDTAMLVFGQIVLSHPPKHFPLHLLNHCLEAFFAERAEQALKWLAQGAGNQNLRLESCFSCVI